MAIQTGSSDTFVEAKPGASNARIMPQTQQSGPSGGLVLAGIAGGLLLGALMGYGFAGGKKTVDAQIGPSKIQVAAGQDQAIGDLRNAYTKLESDKQLATDALASSLRLDQVPSRYRGKTVQETVSNLANADSGPLVIPTGPSGSSGTPGVGSAVRPEPALNPEIKTVITQLDASLNKNVLWLSAYPKFGTDKAWDDNCHKLAKVLASIGAIDDPDKATLAQMQKAVKMVQRDNKLKDDGAVGQKTWTAIKKLVDEKRKA